MAKFPYRGLVINPEGKVIWLYQEQSATGEIDTPGGIVTEENPLTGETTTRPIMGPYDTVIDLRSAVEPGDIRQLISDKNSIRVRWMPDGKFRILQEVEVDEEDENGPTGNTYLVEMDHPIERKRARLRKLRQVDFLRSQGFIDHAEFEALVAETDLTTDEQRTDFQAWAANDGTKAGLLALKQPKLARAVRDGAIAPEVAAAVSHLLRISNESWSPMVAEAIRALKPDKP